MTRKALPQPYPHTLGHRRVRDVIARQHGAMCDYEASAETLGMTQGSVRVFVCHLHRNRLIRRLGPERSMRFEVVREFCGGSNVGRGA
jgi:hypothetical protein